MYWVAAAVGVLFLLLLAIIARAAAGPYPVTMPSP
jgi:hypothetical protein